MNKFAYFLLLVTLSAGASSVSAQEPDGTAPPNSIRHEADRGRPNLMLELGLTADQVKAMRELHVKRMPAIESAQLSVRRANRALDAAIYSDAVSDDEIAARVKELQEAQAAMVALRAEGELSVRKILTAEQLVKFRELRRKFAESRQRRGPGNDGAPPRGRRFLREKALEKNN